MSTVQDKSVLGNSELQSVVVWPDGTWCFSSELEEYLIQGNSDDYSIEQVPASYDDESIEMFVLGVIPGAYVLEGETKLKDAERTLEHLKERVEAVLDWDYVHLTTDCADGRQFYTCLNLLNRYYENNFKDNEM